MLKYVPVVSILLFFLSTLISNRAYSQTKPPQVLRFNLGSTVLSKIKGVPFDIPFVIETPVADNSFEHVILEYSIDPIFYDAIKQKERYYFNPGNRTISPPAWINPKTGKDTVSFVVGPLHPNTLYDFKFTIYRSIPNDDAKLKELNGELTNLLKKRFADISLVNPDFLQSVTIEIEKKVKSTLALNGKFVEKDNPANDFHFDPFALPLKPVSDRIVQLGRKFKDATSQIKSSHDKLVGDPGNARQDNTLLDNIIFETILSKINDIKDSRIQLNGSSKAEITRPLDPVNPVLNKLSLIELFTILSTGPNSYASNVVDNIRGIVNGDSKINSSKEIIDCDCDNKIDAASLSAISAFFKFISYNRLIDTGGKFIFEGEKGFSDEVGEHIIFLLENQQLISSIETEYPNLINSFPDITSQVLLANSFSLNVQTIDDQVSAANPYVGLDFGFVYTHGPTVNPLNSVFLYEGVNIYFTPVNKDTPLHFYKRRDAFFKRFSAYMGFTQSLIKSSNENYKPLIESMNSSLLLGVGFRISKVVRLNVSELLFNQKDPNPQVDKTSLKFAPSISLSFDINIANALGPLAKAFGINQP